MAQTTAAPDTMALARRVLTALASGLLSLILHGVVAGPAILWTILEFPQIEIAGEEDGSDGPMGDGAVGDRGEAPDIDFEEPPAPVNVSMYVPPPPKAAPSPATEAPAAPATEAAAAGSATSDGTGELAVDSNQKKRGIQGNSGVQGDPPKGHKKPCDPVPEIAKVGIKRWQVDRSMIDYYASHLREFDRQAATSTYRNEKKKATGLRIYLPRCSVLRQAGFRNGDIIRSVNGRKVFTLPQAVATWLALRKKSDFEVVLNRKKGDEVTLNYRVIK